MRGRHNQRTRRGSIVKKQQSYRSHDRGCYRSGLSRWEVPRQGAVDQEAQMRDITTRHADGAPMRQRSPSVMSFRLPHGPAGFGAKRAAMLIQGPAHEESYSMHNAKTSYCRHWRTGASRDTDRAQSSRAGIIEVAHILQASHNAFCGTCRGTLDDQCWATSDGEKQHVSSNRTLPRISHVIEPGASCKLLGNPM